MLWSLNELYGGFDAPEFKRDYEEMKEAIAAFKSWASEKLSREAAESMQADELTSVFETYIGFQNNFATLQMLSEYANLILSVDSDNAQATKMLDAIEEISSDISGPDSAFVSFLGWLSKRDGNLIGDVINRSEELKSHGFFINELREQSAYVLSENEEIIIAKMRNTGSAAWEKLRDNLTSNLLINIDGEEKPLAVVRNMAYEKNPDIRKKAYEAELASYPAIDKSVAACINGIKGEVLTETKLRGYASPLDMTLLHSRMSRETLDAMLSAIKDFLPAFRKYYRKKAEMLGHQNGLPFYDLFAPVGESDMKFSFEEAEAFIVRNFTDFSPDLGEFAKRAFREKWIDAEPRKGKRGGAFCANIHKIKQSRIASNFTGSLTDVLTLAHELGHAYHDDCVKDETYVNSSYTMPIAETASTFCETLVSNAALKNASEAEAVTIIENDIMEMGQVIVDIYSRFLFEDEVFKQRPDGSLSVSELNEIMLNAQREAYGDGLDGAFLHPYMWLCKPHYYSADYNYYNFPYAYGLLFAKGLYAIYKKEGEAFPKRYEKLLGETGKNSLEDIAKVMEIDVTKRDFWVASLEGIAEEIERF